MSQLGTRLLFYEVPTIALSDVELLYYAENGRPDHGSARCNELVNDFLCEFFEVNPIGSVDPDSIEFPRDLLQHLTHSAKLLVKGRAQILYEREKNDCEPVAAAPAEGP
jgi:hypothetical protein